MIEYLEQVGRDRECEHWLVRFDGELARARVYVDSDRMMMQQLHEHTALWQMFRHEHLVPVLSSHLYDGRFVVVSGDETGPRFVDAAKLLPELVDREQWAVIEIAGIAEALAAMNDDLARRAGPQAAPFVSQRADSDHMVVGTDGKARLRSPLAWFETHRRENYVGQGAAINRSFTWLSPEQVRAERLTPASDVYQLAVTLYAALTLRRPFTGDNDFAVLEAIVKGPRPPRPDCTPALGELVLRNLTIDPAARDRDPATFAANLRRIHRATNADLRARIAALRPTGRPAPHESGLIVGTRCTKQWDELAPTTHDGIRHCGTCKHDVVHVRSIAALVPLLGKRCVAFEPDGN